MGPAPGEVYIMCRNCGARLGSDDSRLGEQWRDIPCPYKRDEKGTCVTREERPDLY